MPWPRSGYAWYLVWILIGAYTLSYLDRQILNLVLQPIKEDLLLSDTQASLLGGTAFVVFYVAMGIPFGWLADHGNRKRLICFGIVSWTAATIWCGLAPTYEQLFLARVAVGVGEATLTPAALSIIADLFPPERRARPLGLYLIGLTVGPGIALLVGGAILQAFAQGITLPLVGTLAPWRVLFLAAAVPSLPVFLLLLFTAREPARRDVGLGGLEIDRPGLGRVLRYMFIDHRGSFTAILLGWGLTALNAMIILVWMPSLLIRKFGAAPADIGFIMGAIVLFGGSLGVILGPNLVGWLQRRGHDDAYLRAPFLFCLPLLFFSIAAPMAPTAGITFALLAPLIFCNFAAGSLFPGALQAFTPNRMRGQVSAIYSVFNNMIGLAIGPTSVALLTDYVFRDEAALPWSLAIVSAVALPAAVLLFLSGFKPFARDLRAARRLPEPVTGVFYAKPA